MADTLTLSLSRVGSGFTSEIEIKEGGVRGTLKSLKDPAVVVSFICSLVWASWTVWFKDIQSPIIWGLLAFAALLAFCINPVAAAWSRIRDEHRIKQMETQVEEARRSAHTWRNTASHFITLLEALRTLISRKCEKYLIAVQEGTGDSERTRNHLHLNDSLEASLRESVAYMFEFMKSEWREGNERLTLAFFAPDEVGQKLVPKGVADLDRTPEENWIRAWDGHHFEIGGTSFAANLWREARSGRYEPIFIHDLTEAKKTGQWLSLSADRPGCAVGCPVVDKRNRSGEFLGVVIVTIERADAFTGREEEMRRFLEVLSTDILFETRKEQYRYTAWPERKPIRGS